VGMLTALGARFTDAAGEPVAPGARGLAAVRAADLSGLRSLPPRGVTVLTDVTNPLLGPRGAAAVFGPQKGLDVEELATADAALAHVAEIVRAALSSGIETAPGATSLRTPVARTPVDGADPDAPGAGAAGGTGFALRAWGARIEPGAGAVADLIGLDAAIAAASVVVTGEGSYDGQSAAGKAPAHVAAAASATGTPVMLVAGRIEAEAAESVRAMFAESVSLTALAGSSAAALAEPARWLRAAGAELARSSQPRA
jgi:glycerate 2-kinase